MRLNRAGFLRRILLLDAMGGSGEPRAQDPPLRFLRPPWALMEPSFLATCRRCGACIEACPREVLVRAERALESPGTPVFDPCLGACDHCRACLEACFSGALCESEDRRMGTARILPSCLSSKSLACTACLEACPPEANAVTGMKATGVRILKDRCTACGFCLQACPTDPPSIVLEGRPPVPLRGHPPPPAPDGGAA